MSIWFQETSSSHTSIKNKFEKKHQLEAVETETRPKLEGPGRGGGGLGGRRCLQSVGYSSPASMTTRLASVTFKMASKVLIEASDKNFDFITEILI